ncbi:MdtA/MuxA family multidrug efflux RND transporter periplasmic adaptor subunit [Pseudomonas stutzeri]|nr:MdtA/MuxA family multidrug efflux RND transporter periplasmic adaptor subunit [Stutzerimonas stutzeri]
MSEIDLPTRSSRNRWLAGGVVVVLAAALAWWLWPQSGPSSAGARGPGGGSLSAPPGRPRFRDMAGAGVPVRLAEAKLGDFPVELKALGTVTAYNTVNLLPRVDGQLIEVLFEEGQQVEAGQVLARIDPRPYRAALDRAEGDLAERRAELKNAELDLARYAGLFAEDSIARQTLDSQRAKVEQLRGSLKSLEATVADARLNLEFTAVRAPIAGRLGLRQVDVGNLVSSGSATPLVTIAQIAPIVVSFTLPEAELPALLERHRAGATLRVEAWDRGERTRLAEGVLASLDNQIDTATGTVRLKARFANADERLFPNQFVNVRLLLDTRRDALLVPAAAVQFGSSGTFVYVVGEDRKVQMRPIRVAAGNGEQSLIAEGLAAGERVVLEGTDRLRDGSSVEVVEGDFKESAPPVAPGQGGPEGRGPRGERPLPADGSPQRKPAA